MINYNYDDCKKLSLTTTIKDYQDGYYCFEDTVFYGEKGGMPCDVGKINNQKVIDLKWVDDVLWHKVENPLKNPIIMDVDYRTRMINAAAQSALHILDGYYGKMGLIIVAIGVNPDNQWYEVNSKDIDKEHLEQVQTFIDKVIFDDIKTSLKVIGGKDYPNEKYQKFNELRIVSFGDLDTQPCGTIHVNKTSDISNMVILDYEKTSRGTRIYFTSSYVTNEHYKKDYSLLKEVTKTLNVKNDELIDKLQKLQNDHKLFQKEITDLKTQLLNYQAKDYDNGKMIEVAKVELSNSKELVTLTQIISRNYQKNMIMLTKIEDTTHLCIASYNNIARDIYAKISALFEFRGGGSPGIVSANTKADIDDLIVAINRVVDNFR